MTEEMEYRIEVRAIECERRNKKLLTLYTEREKENFCPDKLLTLNSERMREILSSFSLLISPSHTPSLYEIITNYYEAWYFENTIEPSFLFIRSSLISLERFLRVLGEDAMEEKERERLLSLLRLKLPEYLDRCREDSQWF